MVTHVGLGTVGLILVATAFLLRRMGRVWAPSAGSPMIWVPETSSKYTSQAFADPYSWSHILHGFVFYWGIRQVLPSLTPDHALVLATLLEALWEVAENTSTVIDRYRTETASIGYEGDSVLNSVGDILFMLLGYAIASRAPWQLTLLAFIVIELGMAYAYRDNLTLNVIMLLAPSKRIKAWQQQTLPPSAK
jgi:hypothetical protein